MDAAAIESELERLLRRPVQVVALNRASSDLVHREPQGGRIVFERDRAARICFEVRSHRRPPLPGRGPRHVRDVVENHLDDLLELVAAIRARL